MNQQDNPQAQAEHSLAMAAAPLAGQALACDNYAQHPNIFRVCVHCGLSRDEHGRDARATLDPLGARQFWTELSEAFESLTELADLHGARTLVDLMYLQNAILSGGFIDHYPGESSALEIVEALPSGGRWAGYVKVEYMASPQSVNGYQPPSPSM